MSSKKWFISNLIENALKYAGKGSSLEIKTWDEPDWVYIEIIDNGVGISAENLEFVFDKFFSFWCKHSNFLFNRIMTYTKHHKPILEPDLNVNQYS